MESIASEMTGYYLSIWGNKAVYIASNRFYIAISYFIDVCKWIPIS